MRYEEEKNLKACTPCKYKLIMSIIGGILYTFGVGVVMPLGNFSIYIVSYHIHSNKSLSVNYSFFLMPFLTFSLTCFGFIGGLVESKVGCHL